MQHTPLECPGFAELREEMWSEGRETNLSRLLGTPTLTTRVSKFLLATGELYQHRYLTEAEANDEVNLGEAEVEDGW